MGVTKALSKSWEGRFAGRAFSWFRNLFWIVRLANTQIDSFGNPSRTKQAENPGFVLEISLKSPYNWGVCTEVSGTKMVGPQDMENCLLLVRMVALFVAPGRKESWKVMANLFQPAEVVIRVSGLLVWNRVKGPSPGRMVWNLRAASTKMQLLRGLYACPQAWWDAWCDVDVYLERVFWPFAEGDLFHPDLVRKRQKLLSRGPCHVYTIRLCRMLVWDHGIHSSIKETLVTFATISSRDNKNLGTMAYTISMNRGAFLSFAFLFLRERFWEIPDPTVGHGRDGSMTLWPEPCFRPGFGMDFRVGSCCNSSLSALAIFTLWFLRNIAG